MKSDIRFWLLMCGLSLSFSFVACDSSKTQKEIDDISSMTEVGDTAVKDTVPVELSFNTSAEALSYMNKSAHAAKYRSGILPLMAEENLKYCTKLLNNTHNYFIVVDKSKMKVILYDKYGCLKKEYGMACGKNFGTKHKKSDCRTPEGFFTAQGIYDSTDWLYTDDEGNTSDVKGQFGPRFIRIKSPITSQIGIHGTGSPWSIGKRVSHGCIRITNENILELVKYASVGMPIIVVPGITDRKVNSQEGYNIPYITTNVEPLKNATLQGHVPAPKKDTLPDSIPTESQKLINHKDSTTNVDLPKEEPAKEE